MIVICSFEILYRELSTWGDQRFETTLRTILIRINQWRIRRYERRTTLETSFNESDESTSRKGVKIIKNELLHPYHINIYGLQTKLNQIELIIVRKGFHKGIFPK